MDNEDVPTRAAGSPDPKVSIDLRKIDANALRDPYKVGKFQDILLDIERKVKDVTVYSHVDIDKKLAIFNSSVRKAALSTFGPARAKPRQPWMTHATLEVVRWIPVVRRTIFVKTTVARSWLRSVIFSFWRNTLLIRKSIISHEVVYHNGWSTHINYISHRYNLDICHWTKFLVKLQHISKYHIKYDKAIFLEKMAERAGTAADHNDLAASYKIVRLLAGRSASHRLKVVKGPDGNLVSEASEVKAVWQGHFARVFSAPIKEITPDLFPPPPPRGSIQPISFSLTNVIKHINGLGKGKGVGLDGIEAEVLQAGGYSIARSLHDILSVVAQWHYSPMLWRGGRIVDLFKGKGNPSDTDNSRGLLISDHTGKVFTGLLKDHIDEQCFRYLPNEQFGGTKHRGTTFATHLVRTFIDHCRLRSLSCFVLFIDLSKAFDFAFREVLLSWRQGFDADPINHLQSLGLTRDQSVAMAAEIDETGGLFKAIGVDEGAVELIKSLHTNSWFKYSDLHTGIVCNRGGRQGCKLGGLIFNMIYAKALHKLREKMLTAGVVMHVSRSDALPFWASSARVCATNAQGAEAVVEATFVDDEALFISATSPKKLDQAISSVLSDLCEVFGANGFVIHWKPGKTDCLLKHRGTDATRLLKDKCCGEVVRFPLPAIASSPFLHVTTAYKHLGSIISMDGSLVPDANHRASLALNAFAPLAMKLFGCSRISVAIRMEFFETLINSRLLYGTELWTVNGPSSHVAVQRINKVYMQVARRICDCARYGQSACASDLEVRRKLSISAIEVRLRKRRLMYLSRLLVHGPSSLNALLAMRDDDTDVGKLPWTEQIIDDLNIIKQYHHRALEELPKAPDGARAWYDLICGFPAAWKELVDKYVTSESVFDESKEDRVAAGKDLANRGAFVCPTCCPSLGFKSRKALDQHMRTKHNIRSDIPYYIDDSGVCPACGVNLHARAKVITHACETRHRGKHCRVRCRDVILGGNIPRVPNDIFFQLQERDRKLIAAARKAGHTHVRTARPAGRVASAATNRSIASGAKRKLESILPPDVPVTSASTNKKRKFDFANTVHVEDLFAQTNTNCDVPFVPVKRVNCKSSIFNLQHVPAKRVKVKSASHLLYRRV